MPEQHCACGHPYSIHRRDRTTGARHECWSVRGRTDSTPGCQCPRFTETCSPPPETPAGSKRRRRAAGPNGSHSTK